MPHRQFRSCRRFARWSFACFSLALFFVTTAASAAALRVLPAGQKPEDRRLGPPINLTGDFPFTPARTRDEWEKRAEQVRRRALVALGLWPMPTKTPAHAVVHGRIERDGYTVERVSLESFPGHYVTGSLYRPTGKSGKRPGVLCPHGHWPEGRFYDQSKKIRQEIVAGAERFEVGGRSPLQARCVQLARMGCVVFHYDMVGYADSIQLPHRPGLRSHMNTRENWGFQSPQADLRLQSVMGLQTYNSIRALDWFSELPDVDPQRIGVTGASGGGTQTYILGAVDPRPAVNFPAVMVASAMQGTCSCETACCLRIGTGNLELVALFAPKPVGMTGADDWTRNIETKGLPELQQHYSMLGAKGNVMAKALVQFPHNYNYVSRGVMYAWFNKHLKLGFSEPIVEEDYRPLSVAEMTVWDDTHPKPPSGDDYERSLLRTITGDAERQLAALTPRDAASLETYRRTVGGAFDVLIGRGLPEAGVIEHEKIVENDRGDYLEFGSLLRNPKFGEALPVVFLLPKQWNKRVVIWVDERGKESLYETGGGLRHEVRRLVAAGSAVIGVDLIGQGEFTDDGRPLAKVRLNDGGRAPDKWDTYAAFTYCYNHPLFSQRVHDLLSVIAFVKGHERQPETIALVGMGKAAAWVAAARAQAGAAIDRAAVDSLGFRFARINTLDDPEYLPGVVKYGDLPGLLSISAPHALWLAGEGSAAPEIVQAAYRGAGRPDQLTVYRGEPTGKIDAMLDWLAR